MPSVSSLLPEDKARVKRSIPSTNKILTATSARVYYDRAGTWRYAGIQGALVLCVDKQRGGVWWKVVDLLVSATKSGSHLLQPASAGQDGTQRGSERGRWTAIRPRTGTRAIASVWRLLPIDLFVIQDLWTSVQIRSRARLARRRWSRGALVLSRSPP